MEEIRSLVRDSWKISGRCCRLHMFSYTLHLHLFFACTWSLCLWV